MSYILWHFYANITRGLREYKASHTKLKNLGVKLVVQNRSCGLIVHPKTSGDSLCGA